MLNRRQFLCAAGVLAAATLQRRSGHADPPVPSWREADYDVSAYGGPMRILEIFLYGGVSPFETFYFRPEFCNPDQLSALTSTRLTTACDPAGRSGATRTVFRDGTAGRMEWTVATAPLWDRPDLLARTRVVTMTHSLGAHPIAIPLALTGRLPGDPRGATLAAAMKRRYPGQHTSYILMPPSSRFFAADRPAFDAWLSVGQHGTAARPVMLPMSSEASSLATWAARADANPSLADPLNQFYLNDYNRRLAGSRSRGFDSYRGALNSLADSPALVSVFGSPLRREGDLADHCSTTAAGTPAYPTARNTTAVGLDLAVSLFNDRGARYVGLVDVGLGTDTSSAYDGHGSCALVTYGNLFNLLKQLSRVLSSATTPGAGQISSNDTLVILNTEFGRTLKPTTTGRDHYGPFYTSVLIGGSIRATADNQPRLVGAVDVVGGAPRGTFSPANLACVGLAAAGIRADHPDNFAFHELPRTSPVGFEAEFFNA